MTLTDLEPVSSYQERVSTENFQLPELSPAGLAGLSL